MTTSEVLMNDAFHPGYLMHALHARQLAVTPWGWRPAVVRELDEHRVTADYTTDDGTVTVWYHRDLREDLEPGSPVRVHEEHHGLEVLDAWLNVRVEAGIGPVPEPELPELWAQEVPGVLVNQATGEGLVIPPDVVARMRRRQE